MINDLISDLLTRIRNANILASSLLFVPLTFLIYSILVILKLDGFILTFKIVPIKHQFFILILLPVRSKLLKLIRISKSSVRSYITSDKITYSNLFLNKFNVLGYFIISTSKGIMNHKRAKNLGLGGELLFYIQ